MNADLLELVERFAGLSVLVVGDAILDAYLRGSATRMCPEGPAPVVAVRERRYAPGGAANAAHNIQSLGATARFVSVIGDDHEGYLLRRALERASVRTDLVVQSPVRQTLTKQRIIVDGRMLLRFDIGSTTRLANDLAMEVITCLRKAFVEVDAVLVSDYAYGTLTDTVIAALRELQSRTPRMLVVDARAAERYRTLAPTAVKPNYSEALALLGLQSSPAPHQRAAVLESAADCLLDATGARICAVTLDVDGAVAFERGRPAYRAGGVRSAASRATGAGDTFAAALTLALAAGADMPIATHVASVAAQTTLETDGTVACAAQDLRRALWTSADRDNGARLVRR